MNFKKVNYTKIIGNLYPFESSVYIIQIIIQKVIKIRLSHNFYYYIASWCDKILNFKQNVNSIYILVIYTQSMSLRKHN